jgi:hypothetical protein
MSNMHIFYYATCFYHDMGITIQQLILHEPW